MDGTRELHLNSEGSEVTEEYEEDVDVKDYDDKHEGAAEDSLEGSDGPAASIVDCPDDWVNPTGKNVVLGRHSQKYSHTAHLGFYALGLRAYIMFPYCMAHYGGGAFLAVFALLLAVVGVTASLTEMSWGQALNQGMPRVFDEIHPRWTGATASASAAVLMLLCSNTLLVGYCGVYFFNCFRAGDVPWQGEAAGAFWVDSMHGTLTLPLILSLAGACGVQACCQLSTSFMRYATLLIPFPAVVLAVALIRAVSLGGAQDGLNWMFAFDLNDLVSGSTWSAAVGQALLAVGSPGSGSLITFARSIESGKKAYSLCVFTACVSLVFGVFASLSVGAGMGVYAKQRNMQLDALREELGLGLGFVSMSHIASTVGQGSNCFTAILFGSLAVMGLAGADLWFRALSGVLDTCFRHLSTHWNKVLRTALISVAICIVSVITSVASQTWYVRFTDYHVASVLLLGMVLVEFAALHYDYSLCRLGRQTEAHWSSWWFHAAPFAALVIFLRSFIQACISGALAEWGSAAFPLLSVPACTLWFILKRRRDGRRDRSGSMISNGRASPPTQASRSAVPIGLYLLSSNE